MSMTTPTQKPESLLNCPFCGGEARITNSLHNIHEPHRAVQCRSCDASSDYLFGGSKETERLAIAAWNTRASLWVKVTPNSMPEEEIHMLVMIEGVDEPVKAFYVQGEWYNMMAQTIGVPVTHWTPLPQPPTESE